MSMRRDAAVARGDAAVACGDAAVAPGDAAVAPGDAAVAPGDAAVAPGVANTPACADRTAGAAGAESTEDRGGASMRCSTLYTPLTGRKPMVKASSFRTYFPLM